MKFQVDRQTWYRGKGGQMSKLVRPIDRMKCCLGFLGLACGHTEEELIGRSLPSQVLDLRYPSQLDYKEQMIFAKVNDSETMFESEKDREQDLTRMFAALDIEVEFIN